MSRRLFLALWPDESVRNRLFEIQRSFSQYRALSNAKRVSRDNLHMTLHFLGMVTDSQTDQMTSCLDGLELAAFDLEFNMVGLFSKPQIFWLGPESSPEGLSVLHKKTSDCVQRCVPGYQSRSYAPHVSLFRKARNIDMDFECSVCWHVDRYMLVESITHSKGVVYQPVEEWPLI